MAYSSAATSDHGAYKSKCLSTVAHMLALAPGAAVLDVGCGYGGTCIYLARNYDARVTGITLSRKQAEFAGKSARRNRVNDRVSFVVADAEQSAVVESNYNIVWTMESSEHFLDKRSYFRNAANALRPGGHRRAHSARGRACPEFSLADVDGSAVSSAIRLA